MLEHHRRLNEGPAGKRALVKKYSFEKNAIEVFTSVYLYLDKTDWSDFFFQIIVYSFLFHVVQTASGYLQRYARNFNFKKTLLTPVFQRPDNFQNKLKFEDPKPQNLDKYFEIS